MHSNYINPISPITFPQLSHPNPPNLQRPRAQHPRALILRQIRRRIALLLRDLLIATRLRLLRRPARRRTRILAYFDHMVPVLERVRVVGRGVGGFGLAGGLGLDVIVGGLVGLVGVDVVAVGRGLVGFWSGSACREGGLLVVASVVGHVVGGEVDD